MSGYSNLQAGLFNSGNYIISGIPFLTGSLTVSGTEPLEVIFPSVTQMIRIHNNSTGNELRVGFSSNGVKGTNYWLVEDHGTNGKSTDYIELRIKTDRIFLLGHNSTQTTGVYVAAELTGITLGYDLAAAYSGSQNGVNKGIG